MTAGCARCGNCCDPVHFDRETWEALGKWTGPALKGVADPATADGWAIWQKDEAWKDARQEDAVRRYRAGGIWRQNAEFITAHWTPIDDRTFRCDAFDPAARLCTAHDARPPVCRDFPWYGQDPEEKAGEVRLDPQCSYLADLPPGKRPEGSRPLIPLTVL